MTSSTHLTREDGAATCQPRGLHLYIAYEEPSPLLKRQKPCPSPYRISLSDDTDSLLSMVKGVTGEMFIDQDRLLAVWGSLLALRFPSVEDLQHFASCLRRVDIVRCSLAANPICRLLAPELPPCALATPTATASATETASVKGTSCNPDICSDADSPPPADVKRLEAATPAASAVTSAGLGHLG